MIMENKLNKILENIKEHKKVVISLAAVAVLGTVTVAAYANYQEQARQQEIAATRKYNEDSDKKQVDKLLENFDVESDESITKLKEISETSLKSDEGKTYLKTKVDETVRAIIGARINKATAYDLKDTDEKFKNKTLLEDNVKEITKQIDFIKKIDETFKQDNLEETTKSLTDIVDKFKKQIEALKKEEEQKSAEKAKEEEKKQSEAKSKESSGGSSSSSSSSSSNSGYSQSTYEYSSGGGESSQSYSGSNGGGSGYEAPATEQYSSGNSNSGGGSNGYTRYTGTDAGGNAGSYQANHSNGDVRDDNGNHLGNYGGGIADFRQR